MHGRRRQLRSIPHANPHRRTVSIPARAIKVVLGQSKGRDSGVTTSSQRGMERRTLQRTHHIGLVEGVVVVATEP